MSRETGTKYTVVTSRDGMRKAYFNASKGYYEFFTAKSHRYIPTDRRIRTAKAVARLDKLS